MGTAGRQMDSRSGSQTWTEAPLRVDARRESAARLPDSRGSRVPRTDPPGSSNNDRGRQLRRRVRGGPSNPAARCRYRAACYRRRPGRRSDEPVPFRTRAMLFAVRAPTPWSRESPSRQRVPVNGSVLVNLIAITPVSRRPKSSRQPGNSRRFDSAPSFIAVLRTPFATCHAAFSSQTMRGGGRTRPEGAPQLAELGRDVAAFDQVGVSLDHLEFGPCVLAPETDVKLVLAKAQIAHGQVGQPRRKPGVDIQLVARCIRQKSQEHLCQHECRAGSPCLRHVGSYVLHGKICLVAFESGVKLRQLVEQEMAAGETDVVRNLRRLIAKTIALEAHGNDGVVVWPD